MSKPIDPNLSMKTLVDQADNAIDEMVRLLEATRTRTEADQLYRYIEGASHNLNAQYIWEHAHFKWRDD